MGVNPLCDEPDGSAHTVDSADPGGGNDSDDGLEETDDRTSHDTLALAWSCRMPTAGIPWQAIPEGVLDPTRTISGFPFFEHREGDDVSRVRFEFDVMHANAGREMANIGIPFALEEEA